MYSRSTKASRNIPVVAFFSCFYLPVPAHGSCRRGRGRCWLGRRLLLLAVARAGYGAHFVSDPAVGAGDAGVHAVPAGRSAPIGRPPRNDTDQYGNRSGRYYQRSTRIAEAAVLARSSRAEHGLLQNFRRPVLATALLIGNGIDGYVLEAGGVTGPRSIGCSCVVCMCMRRSEAISRVYQANAKKQEHCAPSVSFLTHRNRSSSESARLKERTTSR